MEREKSIIKPLPIVAYGHPSLRAKCTPVETPEEAKNISDKLRATLHPIETAVGLAASQIGIEKTAFIMKDNMRNEIVVINPTIKKVRGNQVFEEGCLSLPKIYETVKRPDIMDVIFYDENLNKVQMRLRKFEAVVFSHELDHTLGVLFIDHLTKEGREKIADQLAEIESGKVSTVYDMIFSPKS
ncbi:MAG: peptide deformylase [bacterium]|nr:peptide deformylase [bacterium]